jgi:hypothetical protein
MWKWGDYWSPGNARDMTGLADIRRYRMICRPAGMVYAIMATTLCTGLAHNFAVIKYRICPAASTVVTISTGLIGWDVVQPFTTGDDIIVTALTSVRGLAMINRPEHRVKRVLRMTCITSI